MYQLLLKQRFKFAVRMVKRNIGAYLILIAIVPCILILQSMIQKNYGMDIAVFYTIWYSLFLVYEFVWNNTKNAYFSWNLYLENRKNIYLESEEDRKSMVLTLSVVVDFILGFSNGGNGLKTVYCGYAL